MAQTLALALICLFVPRALAKPCPDNALFVYSYAHDGASHCACLEGLTCAGSQCTVGGPSNKRYGFYHTTKHAGFDATCEDCFCLAPDQSLAQAREKHPFRTLRATDGGLLRDFPDPLFDATCRPFKEKRCVSQLQGWMQAHYPLNKVQAVSGTVMAMFRHPAKRLVSAFNYGRHSFGMNRLERLRLLKTTETLEGYVNFPGIASCMTKMTLGYNCAHYVRLDESHLQEAKSRLEKDFAFIGLSEHWNASVCLFHRQYGGAMHQTELANLRPGTDIKATTTPSPGAARRRLLSLDGYDPENIGEDDDQDDAVEDARGAEGQGAGPVKPDLFVPGVSYEEGMSRVERNRNVAQLSKVPKTASAQLRREHDPFDFALYEVADYLFRRKLQEVSMAAAAVPRALGNGAEAASEFGAEGPAYVRYLEDELKERTTRRVAVVSGVLCLVGALAYTLGSIQFYSWVDNGLAGGWLFIAGSACFTSAALQDWCLLHAGARHLAAHDTVLPLLLTEGSEAHSRSGTAWTRSSTQMHRPARCCRPWSLPTHIVTVTLCANICFDVGSVFFLPRFAAQLDIGYWLFIMGSFLYILAILLEEGRRFREHGVPWRSSRRELALTVAATSYIAGCAIFIVGCTWPLVTTRAPDTGIHCFVWGSLAMGAGALMALSAVSCAPPPPPPDTTSFSGLINP
ncbi:uncharacterized protein MONBRDRAFT_38476 [Monosiga brevicollis MX1]|uniref:Uncharacterized protein n=1 Tax=Monosiga brevicollis TaxID=81824 RepID=A9V820_MONBE|nr:uncharacterized protein MONBRDRAFT_38476 [Monosiga brevicollis MX1]EDQ86193.1 predicted protein [Monosiga brevicollis MX1]|eukprot:XP_001748863.1 hypothetical protein [Monosiga brevicollis MX1]